jgi:hypothetical protein
VLAIPCVCGEERGGSQGLCCPSIRYRWGVPEKGRFPHFGGSEKNWFPLEASLRRLSRPRFGSDTGPLAVYSSTYEMLARCHGMHQPKECMHGPYGQMPAAAGHCQEMYLSYFYCVYTDSYASTQITSEMPTKIYCFPITALPFCNEEFQLAVKL